MHDFWTRKHTKLDMPVFRAVVVECGCAVQAIGYQPTPCNGAIHPHHPVYQSEGNKSSDIDCIGLCEEHHRQAHKLGREKFFATYRIDRERLSRQYLHYFFERLGLGTLPTIVPKSKKSTRKNRTKFNKSFVPLSERTDL